MDQRLPDPAGAAPPDWRGLCEELVNELQGYASANPYHDSDALVARARAALAAEPVGEPAPPAAGEVAELVPWLRMQGEAQKPGPNSLLSDQTKKERHAIGVKLTRAADLLEQCHLAPVPVAERLPLPQGEEK